MMTRAIIFMLFSMLASCQALIDSEYAVKDIGDGRKMIFFPYFDMLNKYGEGEDAVKEKIEHARNLYEKNEILDRAMVLSVINYIRANDVSLLGCSNDIDISVSSPDEGGNGIATITCE